MTMPAVTETLSECLVPYWGAYVVQTTYIVELHHERHLVGLTVRWTHSHVFVSQGLSLWGPPFRIGSDSEMVVFQVGAR